jgi:hypothetical protein
MKFKRITWFVLFAFCCTIMGPLMMPAAAEAAGTSEIVTELNNLYQYIDQNDKAYLQQARANIGGITESEWNTILGSTVITSKVIGVFGSEEKAKTALKAFATDFSNIYYSPDPNTMESSINNFRKNHSTTFHTLFGTDVTVDNVFTLLSNTRSRIGANIEPDDLCNLAWGTNDELIVTIPEIFKRALDDAITEPFIGKLSAIGWSTDMLIKTKNTIAGCIDPNHNAELALVKATVRSQANLYRKVGATDEQALGRDKVILNMQVGDPSIEFALRIAGRLATTMVMWESSNPKVANLDQDRLADTGDGKPILTANSGGTTTITAYRDYEGASAANDWIIKFDVTVTDHVLSTLVLKSGTSIINLNPAFSSAITTYKAMVPNAIDTVTVTPTVTTAGTTITVNNKHLLSGQASEIIKLDKTGNEANVITVVVSTGSSVATKTYTINIFRAKLEQPGAADTVVITPDTPVTIKASEGTRITFDSTQPLPLVEVSTKTSLGTVMMDIPAGTTVTEPTGWKGEITLPIVKPASSVTVPGSASVEAVIEVGDGENLITFNQPIRILIPNMAGKYTGFIRGGEFTEINRKITADNLNTADAEIPKKRDGYIDVNGHKVIWTKHFTKFVAYDKASSPSPGGGGGSGSLWTTIKSAEGGKLSEYGATIEIPANAIGLKEFKIKIEKVRDTSELPLASGTKILGNVVDITTNTATNFTKPITITLNFDKSKIDTSKYDISLCWLKTSTSKWIELDNVKIDLDAGKISGEVNHFTKFAVIATEKAGIEPPVTPPVTPTPIVLTDITGHWGEANIQKLVNIGAISGYPDKTFKPDANISRAEFAVTLVKALKLDPKNGKIFSDTTNHWAKDSIATAQAYGIISGYSDTKFGPDDKITREQMAVMITKAADLTAGANSKAFTDSARVSTWAKDAVNIASSNGIINGYPDGSFKPQANATRAEAVTVIAKILK